MVWRSMEIVGEPEMKQGSAGTARFRDFLRTPQCQAELDGSQRSGATDGPAPTSLELDTSLGVCCLLYVFHI